MTAPISNREQATLREWVMASVVSVVTTSLLFLPYALGYVTAPEGWEFTGILMNPEDAQTYFAKMLQGFEGNLRYTIPFTSEHHQGAYVGVFYIGLGHLARLLHLSLPAVWHLSRAAADLFLFLVTFEFVTAFLPDKRGRWTAYLLALFGSGLGWLLFALGQPYWLGAFPVDFKQPGAHLFLTAFTFPHVALGTGLTLIAVRLMHGIADADTKRNGSVLPLLVAGVVNLAVGVVYPFLIYLVAAVAASYWLYLTLKEKRLLWLRAIRLAAAFVIPLPLYVHYAITLRTNNVFGAWDAQAVTPSFPWPHYLVSYGLMILLALLGWRTERASRSRFAILWLWILVVILLLQLPLPSQRRFVQGVHVPLSILAAYGMVTAVLPWMARTQAWRVLTSLPRYSTAPLSRLVLVLFLFFMSVSNLYVLVRMSVTATVEQPDTIFRPVWEAEGADWIRLNIPKDSVLMADYLTGNYVAAHTAVRVVLGHWAETAEYESKTRSVAAFYSSSLDSSERQALLSRLQVDYVWYGPREQALGDFDPQVADYLAPVYRNEPITIYAVQHGS